MRGALLIIGLSCCRIWAFQTVLVYPWVTHNPPFQSQIVINNLGPEILTVQLTATRAGGQQAHAERVLSPFEQRVEDTERVFPELGPGPGYVVTLTSPISEVSGAFLVRGTTSPAQANVVSPGTAGEVILFNYLPNRPGENESAPVVVNLGGETASVIFRAFQHGLVLDDFTVDLPVGQPFAALVSTMFPQVIGDLYVTAEADQPMLGVAFIFNDAAEPSMSNAIPLEQAPPAPGVHPLGTWVAKAPMPVAATETSPITIGERIHIAGGFQPLSEFIRMGHFVYFPRENRWEARAPLPFFVHHAPVATLDGKFYLLGGIANLGVPPIRNVLVYDFESDTWTEDEPLPERRGAAAAVTVGRQIYVVGGVLGQNLNRGSTRNESFEPDSGTWTRHADMPTPREHLTAVALDATIYVIGGRDGFGPQGSLATLEAYHTETDTWQSLPPMPTPRSGLGSAVFNGKIYVFGGELFGVFDEVEEYDPVSQTWRQLNRMPVALHGIGAATFGSGIYIIGGGPVEGSAAAVTDVFLFIPPGL